MNQSTRFDAIPAEKTRPRFAVRNKPARREPGPCWAVVDRLEGKVTRRFVYKQTAEQVARELNEQHGPIPAPNPRDTWPCWTDGDRWACLTPPVAPAEEQALEEPTADDREWWAQQDREAESDPLLAGFDSPLMAFLDRMGPDSWEEQDVREFAR